MKIFLILFLALVVRLISSFYQLHDPNFTIHQDNYVYYANLLSKGVINDALRFSTYDARLFPGYPLLIFLAMKVIGSPVIAGYVISLASSLFSIYLFWVITKKTFATLLFSIFPPIWVAQSTKITTEPLTVFLSLLAIILYRKNTIFLSGVVLGLSTSVRLVTICLLIAILFQMVFLKKWKNIEYLTLGFLPFTLLLFVYNYLVFGQEGIFKQFDLYPSIAHASNGLLQVVKDIFRAIDWHQYKILFSSIAYMILSLWALVKLFKYRKYSSLTQLFFYWVLFSLIFVFLYGPVPLLEEFRRFIVPIMPAIIFGILL